MVPSKEQLVTVTLRLLAPLFVGMAVIGGIRNYSIVPFWDMWYSYLDFFFRLQEVGGWKEWWALHNEHRIVLSRILFWIDLAWLDGTVWFLLVVNYLLAGAAFLTFRAILRERAGPSAGTNAAGLVSLFVLICLFSWVQRDNFVWGFQSQFFLAQWLPLLALYLLHRSAAVPPAGSAARFTQACIVGVLCLGTMASGVVALPLMTAYAIVQRMGWKRIGVLALLSAVGLTLYFTDYHSTLGHGSISDLHHQRPVKVLQYVLLYLGSPFYHLFGARSLPLTQLFGLVFIILAAGKAVQCLRKPSEHPLEDCLLAYIAYIGATAFGTGAGRLLLGLNQATSGRYTTPALMGWMALLMLFVPSLLRSLAAWQHRIVWPLFGLLLSMTLYQVQATQSQRPLLFDWEVAALSLELGLRDDIEVAKVLYSTDLGLLISKRAADANISVFGLPSIRDASHRINRPAGALAGTACSGAITEVDILMREQRYRRVKGWIAPAPGQGAIASLDLVNEAGVVVGYALAGESTRPTATLASSAIAKDRQPLQAQVFKGYLLREFDGTTLTLAPREAACSVRVESPPAPPFTMSPAGPSAPQVNVSVRDLVSNEGWTGSDFARSELRGFKTIGSYVTGDADTGAVVLRLRRGATLYYRSGPAGGKQLYRVDDGKRFAGPFPAMHQWAVLAFDHPSLPEEFTLTLSDTGSAWGEWSAIGLMDTP